MNPRALIAALAVTVSLRAEITLGSSRDEVVAELGSPRGTTKAGRREILSYPAGRVVLVDGRVTEMNVPAGSPAAVPSLPGVAADRSPALAPVAAPSASREANDPWLLDFETAKGLAAKENKRILILFTGTDWCGPCQEFQAQVAYNPEFMKAFAASFVFLKINWLRNTPQPPAEAAQTARLRQLYGIASFPSLLVLAADGTQLTRVDTRKGRPASGTADYFIQAIDEARLATRDGQPVKSSWWPF